MKKYLSIGATCLLLTGCAGLNRGCTNWSAEQYGADWLVTKEAYNGVPYMCWRLPATSVANEEKSDGIHWQDPDTRDMVHVSGWYNRVQVYNGQWEVAAKQLNVEYSKCRKGAYPSNIQ